MTWAEHPLQKILIHRKKNIELVIKALEHESLLLCLLFASLDVHLLPE